MEYWKPRFLFLMALLLSSVGLIFDSWSIAALGIMCAFFAFREME